MNHATFKASLFMAAGIIDHETGTRDIRRLTGLFRAMPITGTLAIVASAAMAGVPLLNGFLSKEMFFAETVFVVVAPVGRDRAAGGRDARRRLRRRLLAALRLRHLLRPAADRSAAQAARAAALDARARSSCWCSPAWWSASRRPGRSARCSPPRRGRWSAATLPEYSLAVWHGFNAPLVMSLVAMAGGIVGLPLVLRAHRARRSPTARAACRRLDGKRAVRCHAWRRDRAWLARASARCSARGACSRSCWCMVVVPSPPRSSRRFAAYPLAWGDRPRVPVDARVRAALADRHRLRDRRGVAGQVPPARRA